MYRKIFSKQILTAIENLRSLRDFVSLLPDMPTNIIEDQTFTKITGEAIAGKKTTFENCRFISCDLSYANLSKLVFTECMFEGCNLSLVQLSDTAWQDIQFKDCKLSGADFSKSQDF